MKRAVLGLTGAVMLIGSIVPGAMSQETPTCETVIECAQQMVTLANDLKVENASLRAEIAVLKEELNKQKTALDSGDASLKAAVNKALSELHTFPEGEWQVLDMNDSSRGPGNPQDRFCPSGQLMTGFKAYMEDGHLKFHGRCSIMPNPQLP